MSAYHNDSYCHLKFVILSGVGFFACEATCDVEGPQCRESYQTRFREFSPALQEP